MTASVDPSAGDAAEVLEVLFAAQRAAVRRELAALGDLPPGFAARLLDVAVGCCDCAAAESLILGEGVGPDVLVDVFTGVRGNGLGWLAVERFAEAVASDGAASRFVADGADKGLVAEVLVHSARPRGRDGGGRFVELAPVAASRGEGSFSVADLAALLTGRCPDLLGVRAVEWLGDVVGELAATGLSSLVSVEADSLACSTDQEVVSAWWRSGAPGVVMALLGEDAPPTPEVVHAVAAELESCTRPEALVAAATRMCTFERWVWEPKLAELPGFGEVASVALGLLRRVQGEGVEVAPSAFEAVASLWGRLVDRGWLDGASLELLLALARACPWLVGPLVCTVPAGALVAGAEGDVDGALSMVCALVDEMAGDPKRFGVSALMVESAANRASFSDVCTEGWVRLVANTAGVVPLAVVAGSSSVLSRVVGEVLAGELGDDVVAWQSVVTLASAWEGSVLELAEVARSFSAG